MTLSEGQLLQGRYQIEQPVARGGYGAVYRAFDTTLNRICAVKENLVLGLQAERRFAQEAQLLARLHHPNLPRVIDHFLLPGRGQYLVMDYVEGHNLQEIMRHRMRPFGQDEALAIIYQVCAALAYLHNQSPPIVHRDVKPQNVIVTPGGPVMLVDFGTSKVVHEESGPGVETLMGMRGITPGFAAPEQYGLSPTDARCDVYSVGATLYTLLTGHVPVDALLRLTDKLALPPIRQFNGAVSPAIEQVIAKALEPSATQRLASIDLLVQELHAAQASARLGHRQRSPWLVALAAGGVTLAAILAAGMLRILQENPSTPASPTPAAISVADVTAAGQTPAAAAKVAVQNPAQVAVRLAESSLASTPTSTVPSLLAPQAGPPAFPTPIGGGGDIIFDAGQEGSRDIYRMAPDGTNVVDLTNDPADDWIGSTPSGAGCFFLYSANRDAK
jgi:serine/threonine protein kinase